MEKPLWMICVTHMLVEIYLLIQVALIPVITTEFHLSLLEASLVATVPSLIQLFMNIPAGFFADRLSPNQLLSVSMFIEGLSALLISQTNSFWTLVFGVSLLKIASPLYHILGLSQVSRLSKPEQMSKSMGLHNAFGSLGSAFGVVTLAVLLSTLGWRWTYLLWAFPILAWGFVVMNSSHLKTRKRERPATQSGRRLGRLSLILSSGFLVFLIAIALREIGSTGTSTFMTTYFVDGRGLSESTASLIFGLGPFIGIVGSLAGGYFGQRMGAKFALTWTIVACSISLGMLALVSQLYPLILIYVLYSFFGNAVWSPMNAMVANITSEADRGFGFSVYFFTEGIIGSVTPTLAAGVIQSSNVWFIFPFSIFFLILGLVALQFLPHHKGQALQDRPIWR